MSGVALPTFGIGLVVVGLGIAVTGGNLLIAFFIGGGGATIVRECLKK